MLRRAKARLDQLDFYAARPLDGVRILHVPWLFRLPWFRRFHGYKMGPLILLKRPLAETSDDLVVHELCHVWQDQNRRARMWASYVSRATRTTRTRSRRAGPPRRRASGCARSAGASWPGCRTWPSSTSGAGR